jgi:hypothetical protein
MLQLFLSLFLCIAVAVIVHGLMFDDDYPIPDDFFDSDDDQAISGNSL